MTGAPEATVVAPAASPWYLTFEERPQAGARLYCFPFAGGGAPVYRTWLSTLPRSIELRAVQPPGRQGRIGEPPFTCWADLVGALADVLAPELGELPFAFFGHSMGGLVGFELVRELRRRGLPAPALLGVSGWPPPHVRVLGTRVHELDDERFVAAIRRLGGIPAEVLDIPELLAFVLPALRADFEVCETYRYTPEPPLDCPLTVFGGAADPMAPPGELAAWQDLTRRFGSVRIYPGHHFYLLAQASAVATAFAADLRRQVDPPAEAP